MKTFLAVVALTAILAGCAANKNDVCKLEGGERDQREVCVQK